MPELDDPTTVTPSGLQVGMSAGQRLDLSMRLADERRSNFGYTPSSGERYSNMGSGVPNPYGSGVKAFEPNNQIFDAYASAYNDVASQNAAKDLADAAASSTVNLPQGADPSLGAAGTPLIQGTGSVRTFVDAALNAAARGIPYVWGGTNLGSGVDCSGLIYAAARAAGIDMPRYRAVDYGHMGQAVAIQDARPGDIVYYDEPGDTDHVGIYIGNGQMVQAPTSGSTVKISNVGNASSIRRIFDDSQFGTIAAGPNGGTLTSYAGTYYNPAGTAAARSYQGSTITRSPNRRTTGASAY